MLARNAFRLIVLTGFFGFAGTALGQDRICEYFNSAALEVKATEDPVEKRDILTAKLAAMTKAIDRVQGSPLISDEDAVQLVRLQATLQERSDELSGANGFTRVPDDQLDAFSTFIVQHMEQAHSGTINISVVTLLLIIIIIILIA